MRDLDTPIHYGLAALFRSDPDLALALAKEDGRKHDQEVLRNREGKTNGRKPAHN